MLQRFCLIIALIAFSSCKTRQNDSDTLGVYLNGARWFSKNIKVCWMNPDASLKIDGVPASKIVQDIVAKEYKKADFNFIGWSDCTPDDLKNFSVIPILVADTRPEVESIGCETRQIGKECIKLNFSFDRWSREKCVLNEKNRKSCVEVDSLHEFGHALGLLHEMTHSENMMRKKCDDLNPGEGPTFRSVDVGPYDPDSIMDYCKSEATYSKGLTPELSVGDIKTLNKMYSENLQPKTIIDQKSITLQCPSRRLWDAKFSPDGKKIAGACGDFKIYFWDTSSWKYISKLEGHEAPVVAIDFSPDGRFLLSAGADSTLILWDLATSKKIQESSIKSLDPIQKVEFSLNGEKFLISTKTYSDSNRNEFLVFNTQELKQISNFSGQKGFFFGNENIIIETNYYTTEIIELPTNIRKQFPKDPMPFQQRYANDGGRILGVNRKSPTGFISFGCSIYSFDQFKDSALSKLNKYINPCLTQLVASQNKKYLLVADAMNELKLINLSDSMATNSLASGAKSLRSSDFSPDSNFFAIVYGTNRVNIFPIKYLDFTEKSF